LAKLLQIEVIPNVGKKSKSNLYQGGFSNLQIKIYYIWDDIEGKIIAEESGEPI
jgi:hypothetical protein